MGIPTCGMPTSTYFQKALNTPQTLIKQWEAYHTEFCAAYYAALEHLKFDPDLGPMVRTAVKAAETSWGKPLEEVAGKMREIWELEMEMDVDVDMREGNPQLF